MRKRKVALAVSGFAASAVMALGLAGPASAAQNTAGDSLVNVQVGDVTVQIPVALAANLCDVNVNVLAQQNKAGPTSCTATSDASAEGPPGPGGSENQAGDSLVNVQIGDVTVQVPIGIAANLCDINANVLAEQNKVGRTTCEAESTSTAG